MKQASTNAEKKQLEWQKQVIIEEYKELQSQKESQTLSYGKPQMNFHKY